MINVGPAQNNQVSFPLTNLSGLIEVKLGYCDTVDFLIS